MRCHREVDEPEDRFGALAAYLRRRAASERARGVAGLRQKDARCPPARSADEASPGHIDACGSPLRAGTATRDAAIEIQRVAHGGEHRETGPRQLSLRRARAGVESVEKCNEQPPPLGFHGTR